MAREVRSARGVKIDFDVLKIKQQIASAPAATDVKARESFIDQKFRRRLKKAPQPVAEQVSEISVDPIIPSTEDDTI